MKGHARGARLRHPHQRRAQLILVALACVIVVLSAWLIVVLTLYSALGDAAFRRHPALLPAHPFAAYFATTASLAVARAKAIAANPKDSHALDVASVPHDVGGRTAVVVEHRIEAAEAHLVADLSSAELLRHRHEKLAAFRVGKLAAFRHDAARRTGKPLRHYPLASVFVRAGRVDLADLGENVVARAHQAALF